MYINHHYAHQKLSLYSGIVFVFTFVFFWAWMGDNLPPPNAGWGADQFARRYSDHLTGIRVGFLVSLITICFYLPWTAYVTCRMRAIEGNRYPVLAYLQLLVGCLTVMVVSISMWCWVVAAQRPGRSPEMIQMLTDAGWLMNDTVYMCTTLQMFAMGICFLSAKREEDKVLPAWACYLSFFCAITFFPASLTAVLTHGPFAYHGLIGFWIPYPAWLIWMLVTSFFLLKDLYRRKNAFIE